MSDRPSASFGGLRVAGFESRRAVEMKRLLETAGATAFVSASMREVRLEDNQAALDFTRDLAAGAYDVVVMMTGVGFRLLYSLLDDAHGPPFLQAFGKVTTVARGPKPVAALHEVGLEASVRIGEPNTWRDILAACRDETPRVASARIAILEHGEPSTELVTGLEALGATVTSIPIYEWALPDDLAPLEENLRRIVAGNVDAALLTSSRQVVHMLLIAKRLGIEAPLRTAFERVLVASIGPTTSATLRANGLHVDFEPSHPKLGYLISESAATLPGMKAGKRPVAS